MKESVWLSGFILITCTSAHSGTALLAQTVGRLHWTSSARWVSKMLSSYRRHDLYYRHHVILSCIKYEQQPTREMRVKDGGSSQTKFTRQPVRSRDSASVSEICFVDKRKENRISLVFWGSLLTTPHQFNHWFHLLIFCYACAWKCYHTLISLRFRILSVPGDADSSSHWMAATQFSL